MSSNLLLSHGIVSYYKCYNLMDNNYTKIYTTSFNKFKNKISYTVTGYHGQPGTPDDLRTHFMYRHNEYTIVILNEGKLTYFPNFVMLLSLRELLSTHYISKSFIKVTDSRYQIKMEKFYTSR